MTQDEIIEMAIHVAKLYCMDIEDIVDTIELVAAKEREACAKLCAEDKNQAMDWMGTAYVGKHYADLIRARGEA